MADENQGSWTETAKDNPPTTGTVSPSPAPTRGWPKGKPRGPRAPRGQVVAQTMTPEEKENAAAVDGAIVDVVYDATSRLLVLFARQRGLGAVADQIAFTAEEKEALAKPTIAVVNKYFPTGFGGKFQEEIVLGLTLFGVLSAKYAIVRAEVARLSMQGETIN